MPKAPLSLCGEPATIQPWYRFFLILPNGASVSPLQLDFGVARECPTRGFYKGPTEVLQECLVCKSIPQKHPTSTASPLGSHRLLLSLSLPSSLNQSSSSQIATTGAWHLLRNFVVSISVCVVGCPSGARVQSAPVSPNILPGARVWQKLRSFKL